ncbi:TetR/AcrR family transcriptional regulator [Paenibacillus sp. LHD-117]|uniref:TetR/AcrR family transcriptional regulator n=1 Tax=Paenibacillus sp. LHD-117 TaxID=3071412 RepID=UPI0027E0AD51|nr:TetR/AcrR family transcriptional regulator [Paenibacillus sp. LHD-117]MDQ6420538.1 TetR/AcrR family transcriptional regulator [Paenibacillus sp. LHD-117]
MSKNKIIDAAVKLFSELGYHRTSMDDISREAGVAKGTLYYHFSGKGELFETIVTYGYTMLMDRIKVILQEDQPTDLQIRAIVHKHLELFLQFSELVHIISNETTNGIEPDILQRIRDLKQGYIAFLSGVLEEGIKEGALKPVNSELAASGMLGMLDSLCVQYVGKEGNWSLEELYETANAFILPALLKDH